MYRSSVEVFPWRRVVMLLVIGWMSARIAFAADPAGTDRPRATLGDTVTEPQWEQRLVVSVGPAQTDIVGVTDKAIQAAVDYVARWGGGTVKLLPGDYTLRNAVYLRSKVRLAGSGEKTVLIKAPSATSALADDSDWFDQEITLADARGFEIGDGVCLRNKNGGDVVKRTLVARSGNRFKLDDGLRKSFWRSNHTTVATLFPILSGENVTDIAIENLVLEGNRANNANLDGNYAGCIFLQECHRIAIRNVIARNYNGDGLSWQICHDVLVENCTSQGHTGLGLHPGSGSQRTVIRNCRLVGNDIGLFFCWGVRRGIAQQNHIEGNRVGISIGHHDTDNLVTGNEVLRNRDVGVLFRPERGKDFAGRRNCIEKNRLIDNGSEKGYAVDIQGGTESVVLADNEIRDSRGGIHSPPAAIRLGRETRDITLRNNQVEGFAKDVER